MRLLDRLKGYLSEEPTDPRAGYSGYGATRTTMRPTRTDDEIAVERYRYLLRTAQPDAVEEVHAEAFARLTPQQRRMVFEELSQHAAVADRPASDDPRVLARSATRSELREPGFLERTLGSGGAGTRGLGMGGVVGGSMLGTVAGVVIGSAIADMVLPGIGDVASEVAGGADGGLDDLASGFDDLGGDF